MSRFQTSANCLPERENKITFGLKKKTAACSNFTHCSRLVVNISVNVEMSRYIGGHFHSFRIQVPKGEEEAKSTKEGKLHLITVSRFGYQVSFHLQFQKTRVPKSVTIFPDQSWIHMPATLRSHALHQVPPGFRVLLHPRGASALCPFPPEPPR